MTDNTPPLPWYRRTLRWGQTNLNELDPTRYDAEWWRAYWRRTRVQGLVATLVPPFPIYPPEFSWMREPTSDVPAIVTRQDPAGGRLVYLAADVDRCYGRRGLPDHGTLLANAVRWAVRDSLPLRVEGPGFIDCHLYRQEGRLILHLVNLSGCDARPAYLEEHLPAGPLRVSVRLEGGFAPQRARLRVVDATADLDLSDDWATLELPALVDHELVVFE